MELDLLEIVRASPPEVARDGCDLCGAAAGRESCDTCESRLCQSCRVRSDILPLSCFCSSECRDEAELAAEGAGGKFKISNLRFQT